MLNKTIKFFEVLSTGKFADMENYLNDDCQYFNWIQSYKAKNEIIESFENLIKSAKLSTLTFETIHQADDIVFTEIKLNLDKRVVNLCFVVGYNNNKISRINGYKR